MGRRAGTLRLACKAPGCIRASVSRGHCRRHYQQLWVYGKLSPKPDAEKRFWSKVDIRGADECWPWQKGLYPAGYGMFRTAEGQVTVAHRVAYTDAVGPIPPGLFLDHMCHDPSCTLGDLCPHRRCCNPAHLRPSTPAENSDPSRAVRDRGLRATHCPRGHEYTPENTRTDKRGGRHCRECESRRKR
jgi:hypothetical protein